MKKSNRNHTILNVILYGMCMMVCLTGCGSGDEVTGDKLEKSSKAADEKTEPAEEFTYQESKDGITLTKYNGSDTKVIIPDEINGIPVVELKASLFDETDELKEVTIPETVEHIDDGIFDKFPMLTVCAYDGTAGDEATNGKEVAFQSLGPVKTGAHYVDIYSSETTGIMQYTRLYDGEEGKQGEYSEGASFSSQNGEAVLTLNNYNGGMIKVGGYGTLTIRLEKDSENHITAADKNEGIMASGTLTIEGRGSLSVKAGPYAEENVCIYAYNGILVREGVRLFAKGPSEKNISYGMLSYGGNIEVKDSYVELQAGTSEQGGTAICVKKGILNDGVDNGNILLEDCQIVEGGMISDIEIQDYEGATYKSGQSVSDKLTVGTQWDEIMEQEQVIGASEYVRIEPEQTQEVQ